MHDEFSPASPVRFRPSRQAVKALIGTVLMLVLLAAMVTLVQLPGMATRSLQAMQNDSSLPFLAWNRAIANAPSREARITLQDARDDMLATFEAPLVRSVLYTRPGDVVRTWTLLHAAPAQLFQMLGGMTAYHSAVSEAQNRALDEDAQANLDAGRVRRGDVLAQALPALTSVR